MKKYVFATLLFILLIILATHGSISPIKQTYAQNNSAEKDWQLSITGLVKSPLTINLTEIRSLPSISLHAQLFCVDFPDRLVMEGTWTGVRLSYILNQAEIKAEAAKIALYAADGYSTDLSLVQAMNEDIIIAYEKDGEELPETLRLVAPGLWGYKWIAQITRIEIVDYNFLGQWEAFGYSDQATINSNSGTDSQTLIEIPILPDKTLPTQVPTLTPTPTTDVPTQTEPVASQLPTPTTNPTQTPSPTQPLTTNQPTPSPELKQENPSNSPTPSDIQNKPSSGNNNPTICFNKTLFPLPLFPMITIV